MVSVRQVHLLDEPSPEVLDHYDQPIDYGPVIEVDASGPTKRPGIAAQVH